MSADSKFRDAQRLQGNFLAAAEKRLLIGIAQRLPRFINSDHLTVLGFLGLVGAGASFALARWNQSWLIGVVVMLFVNWFGDSLDGTLARVRNKLRPRYGFYVDHVLDSVGAIFLLGGLAISGYMAKDIALVLLIAYLMLSIEIYLATYTVGVFRLSFGKFGPTELRILFMFGTLYLLFHPYVKLFGRTVRLFDVGGVVGIAGMILLLLYSIIRNTVVLYREETI